MTVAYFLPQLSNWVFARLCELKSPDEEPFLCNCLTSLWREIAGFQRKEDAICSVSFAICKEHLAIAFYSSSLKMDWGEIEVNFPNDICAYEMSLILVFVFSLTRLQMMDHVDYMCRPADSQEQTPPN